MEMPISDVNDLDEVVCELEIEDSDMSPAEAVREMKAEIASLRANQERIRDEAFQLGRQASWDEAKETIKRLQAELSTWQHVYLHLRSLLGVDRGDMTDPQLWQATETALRKVLAAARLGAEEIARLKALVQEALESAPSGTGFQARCRAALACRPQGEKS